jgi:hypothetical protein
MVAAEAVLAQQVRQVVTEMLVVQVHLVAVNVMPVVVVAQVVLVDSMEIAP